MLHPLRKKIGDGMWNLVVSLLISFSLSMLWSRTFLSEGHAVSVLVRCAVFLGVFVLVDLLPGKVWKPVFYTLVICAGAGTAFLGVGPAYEMLQGCKAMFLQWTMRPEGAARDAAIYAAFYTEDLRTLLCLIICVLMYAQVSEDAFGTCVFMFAVFTALPFMLIQFPAYPVLPFSPTEGLRMAAPGAAGIVLVMSSRGGRQAGLLPVAALLTAAAIVIAPAEGTVNPDLNRMAEQASWYGRDLFFTGENRSAFSLASTDYMPLKDRMGGSVHKTSDPVMMVTTDSRGSVYLKGSSCDTYTGFGWQDTLSDRGFLFSGPFSGADREKAFGKTQKMETPAVTVNVRMLRGGDTTVFSPQRILAFSGGNERMVLYFSRTGELYITRNMEQGDSYTITCLTPDENDARSYLSSVSAGKDSLWEQICSDYLNVPDSVSPVVTDMTMDIIFGIPDPLERAVAIRDYLKREYPYSLRTGTPDPDEDFVSWFLLKEKKGYCTYFASAMTIMCRIAGIPARYVIGYAFNPSEDGTTTVTTSDGHAWTEIYIEGFGWLTMDATGSMNSGNSGGGDDRGREWEVSARTPAPSAMPTAGAGQNGNEIEDPSGGGSRKTPTPNPEKTSSPEQRQTDTPGQNDPRQTPVPEHRNQRQKTNPWVLAIILIILCLVTAVFAFYILARMSSPGYRAARHPDQSAVIFLEGAFRICQEKYGYIHDSETWTEYAERIEIDNHSPYLKKAAQDYQDAFYKKDHIPDNDNAVMFYKDMWSGCAIPLKGRIILKRIFRK